MSDTSSFPIIDLSLSDVEASKALAAACHTTGFFAIKNHSIPLKLIQEVFKSSENFFSLSKAEKMKSNIIQPGNRGYVSFSSEKLNPKSKQEDSKECFNIVPEPDTYDDFRQQEEKQEKQTEQEKEEKEEEFLNKLSPSDQQEFHRRWPIIKSNQFLFRATMLSYVAESMKLSNRLFRLFAVMLGLKDENHFAPFFQKPTATLRLLHYPKEEENSNDGENKEQKVAAGEHTDYDAITLLIVRGGVGGLQVQHRETGKWISAPSSFASSNNNNNNNNNNDINELGAVIIVNIADCLMRWSNDVLKSTPHRVLQPTQERYSVALFIGPHPSTVITALPGTVAEGEEAKYAPITAGDHLLMKLKETYGF